MKKFTKLFAVLMAVAVIISSCTTTSINRDPNAEYELVILHTNDHHGATVSKDGKYGLAERATFIKGVREANENVLLIDAGDINTGSALSNMFNAEPDIKAYNQMKYDAVAFGNHEFDGSLAKLKKQMKISEFPWLSANIKKGRNYLGEPYLIKDYPGFRVGIIGLTSLRTKVIASPDSSLMFEDEITVAKQMVTDLRENKQCDIIVVLGHLGSVEETEGQNTSIKVAEQVSGIDLIIDGHSHTYFKEPLEVNGTYIVSANEWGKYVGEGNLIIKDGKMISFTWQDVEITSEAFPPDAEVTAIIAPYAEKAAASLKEVVMVTTDEFVFGDRLSRKKEIALGDLVSDAQVGYLASMGITVDFGFTNGGNIRTNLPKGDVTRENIMTVLPFENYVYVIALKGNDVIDLFNFIGSIPQGAGAFPQMSKEVSYTLTYDETGTKGSISDVKVNGTSIDPNKVYKIAVNDYLAGGGDGYVVLTRSVDTFNTSLLMSDIVIDYVQSLPSPITPKTDGRINIIGGLKLD